MTRSKGRLTVAIVVLVMALGAAVALGYLYFARGPAPEVLPPGCVRPAGGFLMVASSAGFNGSADHGVPAHPWPVMDVGLGSNVTIRVCNADNQPHGFQISHYYNNGIVALDSGQVLTVSFVADQAGVFQVFCSIPCSVHWAMLSGQLRVS